MFDEQSIGFVRPSARNSVRCVCTYARYDGVMPIESEKVESVENFL